MVQSKKFTVFKGEPGSGKIVRSTTEKKIGPDELLIRVTHSGLCGTDCHYKQAGIGLGHEGIGTVEELGSACTKFKKGDVIGWGYIHNTCGECAQCLSGNEVYCDRPELFGYANTDQGSLSTHAVWREAYCFAIPPELTPANAAPLMCAGATIYSALHSTGCNSSHTVGVVGIGGLGHLAIQFAAKMGCRVVVFSSTDSKRDEALKLGAHEFYATKGVSEFQVAHKIDHLLVSTSVLPDWTPYFNVMAKRGYVIPLSIANGTMDVPYMPLMINGLTVSGGIICTRHVHNLMLDFAARHKIQAVIEEFPMNEAGIEKAFDKLENGGLRYRAVLKN